MIRFFGPKLTEQARAALEDCLTIRNIRPDSCEDDCCVAIEDNQAIITIVKPDNSEQVIETGLGLYPFVKPIEGYYMDQGLVGLWSEVYAYRKNALDSI